MSEVCIHFSDNEINHLIASIPDVADIDIGPRHFGDLCKIGGVYHIWSGSRWLRVEDANRLIAIGMRCH